jgi:hypothetical protein
MKTLASEAMSYGGWAIFFAIAIVHMTGRGVEDFVTVWLRAHGLYHLFMTVVLVGPTLLFVVAQSQRVRRFRMRRKLKQLVERRTARCSG